MSHGLTGPLPPVPVPTHYSAHLYVDKEHWITVELPYNSSGGFQTTYVTPWMHSHVCMVKDSGSSAPSKAIRQFEFLLIKEDAPGHALYALNMVHV